ncbi:MAG: YchF family ATPase [Oscillospiraceae bacterium]|jgi:GTP-binding protein YchF|nr:YchF family ATPase [Oscillospiraceae bacterium]
MKLGIIGLPGSGRRTLFGALTGVVNQGLYGNSGQNIGIVKVPDKRLDWLTELYAPKKTTNAAIEFVLPLGSDRTSLRQADALVHVVNCFGNENPAENAEDLTTELLLSDIESAEKRIERAKKNAKGDKKFAEEAATLERLRNHLGQGKPAREFDVSVPELLTNKPVIYVANVAESGLSDDKFIFDGADALTVCAKLECDLLELEPDERQTFLDDLGVSETGLDAMIRRSYEILGLISFLTAGKDEVRAWTIRDGTKAPGAAGKIHSDLERGFIRAEVVAFDDLKANGSMKAVKDKGLARMEGKEYIVKDGDVMNILFNV